MWRAPESTSNVPATSATGTRIWLSGTRACSEVRRARWAYQSTGVLRNSETATGGSSGCGTGNMKPVRVSSEIARGPTGSRAAIGVRARPPSLNAREMLTVTARAAKRGSRNGESIVEKVSPGTPATANSPRTRSGWARVSSNIVFTPIDQPISTARSTPKWSITERPSPTNSSMPTRCGSVGRSEPPVPRWFQETTRTPQSGRSSAGQVQGLVPRPLQSTTVGPSMRPSGSLVHARRRVPSSERTSWNSTAVTVAARAAAADMGQIVPQRGLPERDLWLSSPEGSGRRAAPVNSALCSVSCVLHVGVPAEGGEELLDLVELGTPLCQCGGGDQGVAPRAVLRLDRPAHDDV